jgi:hypothetical protein
MLEPIIIFIARDVLLLATRGCLWWDEINGGIKNALKWATIGAFIIGWVLMFIVLGKIYVETL